MILKIYKYISNFFSIFIIFYFLIRLFKAKETIRSIKEKFTFYKLKKPVGKLIWINAVSIGEALSIITIIKRIKKHYPSCKILLTTSTLTSMRIISNKKLNIIHQFSPIDINFIVKRFINYWRPDLALSVESEIWPNLIIESQQKKIPYLLLNARISNKSFQRWKKINYYTKHLFESFKICFSQDNDSSKRFRILGVKNVKEVGNLKFFSTKQAVKKSKLKILKETLRNKFIILLASSHNGEEELIISIQNRLKLKIPNIFFIIIPRHIERTNKIQKLMKKNKKIFKVRSKNEKITNNTEFYIADTFGETGLFYTLSKITIMGGSFVNHGGQNPIEASFFNTAVLFGPYMFNFKKISEKLVSKSAAIKVENADELKQRIISLNKNKEFRENVSQNLKKFCKNERAKEVKFWSSLNKFLSMHI